LTESLKTKLIHSDELYTYDDQILFDQNNVVENTVVENTVVENTVVENTVVENTVVENTNFLYKLDQNNNLHDNNLNIENIDNKYNQYLDNSIEDEKNQ